MTTVTLLENTAFYSHLFDLIEGASRSIYIAHFSFNVEANLDTQQRVRNIVKLLAKQCGAGLDVRVLLGNRYKADPQQAFQELDSSNELTYTLLSACGVPAGFFQHSQLGSSHSKYVLIDGRITVLGSHNISPRALTVGKDDSVAIDDPAVAATVTARFTADWAVATQPPAGEVVSFNDALFERETDKPEPILAPRITDDMSMEVLFEKLYFDRVLQAIWDAQTSIDVAMFYFSTSRSNSTVTARLATALVAAQGRGVTVRVMLDRDKPGDLYASEKANRQRYTQLQQAGIQVKWDAPEDVSHTKLMIVDQETVFIGSHNWTEGSYSAYQDLSVAIKSPALAQKYASVYDGRFNP